MVSEASDKMPPTTGMAPEMANLATFMDMASTDPDTTPLMDKYPTNTIISTTNTEVATHFSHPAICLSPGLPRAAHATLAATYP